MKHINEKRKLVEKIDALRGQGMTMEDACKKVGTSPATYYYHVQAIKKDGTPTIITHANDKKEKITRKPKSSMKLIALVGDAEQVMNALRNL